MILRAPIKTKKRDQKWNADWFEGWQQKDSAAAPLLVTEFCSDSGFIEVALKCLLQTSQPNSSAHVSGKSFEAGDGF